MEPPANKGNWDDLGTRTASSVALALLALFCVWLGGVAFTSLVILAAVLLIREWSNLTTNQPLVMRLMGYVYIILPCSCIIWLRDINLPSDYNFGFKVVLALIAIISATDTGAYFAGKKFGYNKLWPSVSPNKTWEGLLGGIAVATVTGMIFAAYINLQQSFIAILFISPIIAVVAQAGDLFKSWIKRRAGVKDSGTLIPGHGGLLDRIDGYMFTTPLLALIIHLALKDIMQ